MINLPLPPHLAEGRLQVVQHSVGEVSVLTANLYGFSKGQIFPDVLQHTESLLEVVTREVVLGKSGFRIVAGDYNHDISELQQI